MDNSENALWGATALCTAIWLIGWVGFDPGLWIHVFIAAALVLAILIFAQALHGRAGGR